MKRVVLDTNVLVAGLRSHDGASFAVLKLVAERRLVPLVSTALFLEYEAVLTSSEHLGLHGFSIEEIGQILAEFAALAEAIEVHFLWRPQLTDPQDEMVLEAAVNGRADALVTHNVRDFSVASRQFNLPIIRPREVLEGMRR